MVQCQHLGSAQRLVYQAPLLRLVCCLECSTQRASWSFSDVRSCPCLSRLGVFVAPIFSTDQFSDFIDISLLYLLCSFLCFPCQLLHICLLSARIFLLTLVLTSAYAALYLSQSLADLLSLIFFFSRRLSSIACHVAGVIHSSFS